MIIGTTPTHRFNIPLDVVNIDEVHVLYSQYEDVKIRKVKADCTLYDRTIEVRLSQEETFLFSNAPVSVQIRVKCGETVLSSKIFPLMADKCLEKEVM